MKKLYSIIFWLTIFSQSFAQWTHSTNNANFDLHNVQMVSTTTGYMVGMDGVYLTEDAGADWNRLSYIQSDGMYYQTHFYYDLHFFNPSLGMVCGYSNHDGKGIIVRTLNGGITWEVLYLGASSVRYVAMDFSDGINGVAVGGSGNIIYTYNAGVNWVPVASGVTTPLNDVDFAPQNTGVGLIATNGALLRSTDAGVNWSTISIPGQDFKTVHFATTDTAYARSSQNKLYKSIDAGATWQQLNSNLPYAGDIYFLTADTGYACGNDIYRTTDGGTVWEKQDIPNNGTFIYFYGNRLGISGGGISVYTTTNAGGNVWTPMINLNLTGAYTCTDSTYYFQTINSPNYTYQWRLNGQLISTNSADSAVMTGTGTADTLSVTVSNATTTVSQQTIFNTFQTLAFTLPPLRTNRDSVCRGQTVTFYLDSTKTGTNYQLFINGTNVGSAVSGTGGTLSFTTPAIYTTASATIKVRRYGGACGIFETAHNRTIVVTAPDTVPMAPWPSHICRRDTAVIQIQSSQPGTTYTLYYGSNNQGVNVTGNGGTVYLKSNGGLSSTVMLSVRATNYLGCTANMPPIDSFYVRQLTTDFSRLSEAFVGQNVQLQNLSDGDNYHWTFDPSASLLTDTTTQPAVSYNTIGDKLISLRATTTDGCDDTIIKQVRVFNLADTTAPGTLCRFDTMRLAHFTNAFTTTAYHVDRFGNHYIAGWYGGGQGASYTGAIHYSLIKLDASGNMVWQKYSEASLYPAWQIQDYQSSYITGISTDPYGNVYVCGTFSTKYKFTFDTITIYPIKEEVNYFMAKLRSDGDLVWFNHNDYGYQTSGATDILYVDANTVLVSFYSNYLVLHNYGDSLYNAHTHSGIMRLNSDGMPIQVYPFEMLPYIDINPLAPNIYNPNTGSFMTTKCTRLDPRMHLRSDGKIVLTGKFKGHMLFGDSLRVGVDSLDVGGSGYVALLDLNTGWESAFATYRTGFSWPDIQRDVRSISAVNNNGDVYVSKRMEGKLQVINGPGFTDTAATNILMRYGVDKALNFAVKIDATINAIASSDDNSEVYIAGNYTGLAGFSSVNGNKNARSAVNKGDAFLAAYDSSGNFKWVENIGGNENQQIELLHKVCGGAIYGIGMANATTTMKGSTLPLSTSKNFGFKYSPTGTTCQNQVCPAYVTLYDTVYNCSVNNDTTYEEANQLIKDSVTFYSTVNSLDTTYTYDTIVTVTVQNDVDTAHYTSNANWYDAANVIYNTRYLDSAVCIGNISTLISTKYKVTMRILRGIIFTGIDEIGISNITLYPNPADENLHFGNVPSAINEVRVYNVTGALQQVVYQPAGNAIYVGDLVPGMYTVELLMREGNPKFQWMKK